MCSVRIQRQNVLATCEKHQHHHRRRRRCAIDEASATQPQHAA